MKLWKLATAATVIMASSSANAALIERLGGLAYYDTEADLTWLADANAAGTTMNWANANAWAAGLEVAGVTGWRLPDTLQPDASCDYQSGNYSSGSNCTGSEMGNLFYNVLGGVAGQQITTTHNANYYLFTNLLNYTWWTNTEVGPEYPYDAWYFNALGTTGTAPTHFNYTPWAVHTGDVSAVPVPAAVWLFGSGLLGLIGVARRKSRA